MVNPYESPASDVAASPTFEEIRNRARKDHKMAGRSLQAMGWLQMIGVVGICAAIFIPAFQAGQFPPPKDLLLLLSVFLPLFSIFVGRGVSKQMPWARKVAFGYCALMLIGVPVGTLVGAYILFYLIRDK